MEFEINTTYLGDCVEIMKGFPDQSIDMILCDLPYGTTRNRWDTIIPFEPLWEQYTRLIKPRSAIVLTASQPFTSKLVLSNLKLFKYAWVWEKSRITNFLNAKFQPLKQHEDILVFSINKTKYFPQGVAQIERLCKGGGEREGYNSVADRPYIQTTTGYPRTIIKIPSETNGYHPTQKPVALFEYLIKTYTDTGDLVLDNCAGSGTTGIACKNTGRNYIMIEKEKKYFDMIIERMKQYDSDTKKD